LIIIEVSPTGVVMQVCNPFPAVAQHLRSYRGQACMPVVAAVVTDSAVRRLAHVGVARHDQTHDKSRQADCAASQVCALTG
jgi:hypothetical protein